MTNKFVCKRCQAPLTWADMKNFDAKAGPGRFAYYGGYLCIPCLEHSHGMPTAPKEDTE